MELTSIAASTCGSWARQLPPRLRRLEGLVHQARLRRGAHQSSVACSRAVTLTTSAFEASKASTTTFLRGHANPTRSTARPHPASTTVPNHSICPRHSSCSKNGSLPKHPRFPKHPRSLPKHLRRLPKHLRGLPKHPRCLPKNPRRSQKSDAPMYPSDIPTGYRPASSSWPWGRRVPTLSWAHAS